MAVFQAIRSCSGVISARSPERVLQRHAGTAVGDGLRMAERAGAALTRLDRFYGHLLSRDAMRDDGLWPYPQIDAVATAGIVVDSGGRRLLDEGLGGISITNDLARLDDPLCATVICDAAIWDTAGRAAQIPPNPQLVEGGGTLHEADTIEELAGSGRPRSGDPARHRGRLQRGGTQRARSRNWRRRARRRAARHGRSRRRRSTRSRSAPASRTRSAASRSTGTAGSAVPTARSSTGLYAAGGCTGGLEGGGALGYVGGLIKACVFGLRAGEDAARRIRPGAA